MVKSKLKSRELSSAMINLLTVKMLFTYPRFLVERCENGAWISVIVYGIVALAVFFLTGMLYIRTEKLSILSQSEYLGGKFLKAAVGIISILLLMMNIAPMVRAFPEAIKTALLQKASMLFITSVLAVGITIGAYYGIEALSRIASVFLPVALLFILVFFILLAPEYDINNLYPLSVEKALKEGSTSLSVFSDIFVLNFLLTYSENSKTVLKSGLTAILVSMICGALITFVYCLVYPYPSSARFIVPMYQMSRIVSVGTYFQRLEAVFEFVWSVSIFIYASIYIWVMCDIFRLSFNLKHNKPLTVPMLIILLAFVFNEESYIKTLRANFVSSMILYPAFFIIPLIIGLWYISKRKRKGALNR